MPPVGRFWANTPGAIFFTLGQRQGLGVGARAGGLGLPYYVVDKDMNDNKVYVSQRIDHQGLWVEQMDLADCHWLDQPPPADQTA